MRYLFVGDPHVTPNEIPDAEKLMEFIDKKLSSTEIDALVFLGDLFHSHGVVHLQVLNFWNTWLTRFSQRCQVISLVGNHDQDLKDPSLHALKTLKQITVADPVYQDDECLFVSYHGPKNQDNFIDKCKMAQNKVLICHETFQGAQYDNGFYAKDGIEQELIPNETIISGHIHTASKIGKVTYLGSPRWRTMSDANIKKAIYLIEIKDQKIVLIKPFSTGKVCTPIYKFSLPQDQKKYEAVKDSGAKIVVTVSGTEQQIEEIKLNLGPTDGVMVKENIVTDNSYKIKESMGVVSEFEKFKDTFADGKVLDKDYFDSAVDSRIISNL